MNIRQRLEHLEAELCRDREWMTAFTLADSSLLYTEDDPITYLLKNGTITPRGRIIGYDPPKGQSDPISRAVIHEISKRIEVGSRP